MQRPILILVLVVCAIGALLFGVFHLLREPDVAPDDTPAVVRHPPAAHVEPGSALSGDAGTGKLAVEPSVDRDAGVESENFQYDNQLTGSVVSPDHRPLPEVELVLTKVGASGMFFTNDPVDHSKDITRRTDKDGHFDFRNIEPRSKYRLVLRHPDYARKEIDTVPVGAQGTYTEPEIVMLAGAQLTGYVKDEAGANVRGATLVLDGAQFAASPYDAPDRMSVQTSAEGYYVFANIPAGDRTMVVTAPGYGALTLHGIKFRLGQDPMTRDVILKPAETICGRVLDAAGQPIAGAALTAIGFNSTQQSTRVQAASDAKGEFCLEGLMPGQYNLVAAARGFRFERAMRVASNSSNNVLHGIREADVCGQVVDGATGQPITSFSVRLRVAATGSPVSQPLLETETPTSSATGEYCLVGVQQSGDGGYLVEARAPGYAPGYSAMVQVEPSKNITVPTIRLTHGGALRGRVVDSDGKPVARALVTTHDNEWTDDDFMNSVPDYPTDATSASARTNPQGYFVIKNLRPELYQITVEAAGFTGYAQADINVAADQENDAGDVKLLRGGTFKGTLFDANGQPLAGGTIELAILDGDHPVTYRAKTSADGSYTIANVLPGLYRLNATAAGEQDTNPFDGVLPRKSADQKITIANGETLTGVNVTMKP